MSFEIDHHARVIRSKDRQPLRTKIVATIGSPGTDGSYKDGVRLLDETTLSKEQITYTTLVRGFIENGVDVIRLNLTHVEPADVAPVYAAVRAAILDCERDNAVTDKRIAVLADLPGPKIRFNFKPAVEFVSGARFRVTFASSNDRRGLVYVGDLPLKDAMLEADERLAMALHEKSYTSERAKIVENLLGTGMGHPEHVDTFTKMMRVIKDRIAEGVLVRIGDGEVVLRVDASGNDYLDCTVVSAKEAKLDGKKGFTLKGVDLEIPSFTPADQAKLDSLLESEHRLSNEDRGGALLTFIALSFAQSANDVLRMKYYIHHKLQALYGEDLEGSSNAPAVIAKIESKKGWDNRELILDVADGVMVARGDLGLQLEIESVPSIQKILIKLCNKRGKPVITATEMLKTMTDSIEPTRAEASDVFNAILDGSDAVMMSEETSKGKYPYHAVRKMIAIAVEAEIYAEFKGIKSATQQRNAYQQQFQEFFVDAEAIIESNAQRFDSIIALLTTAHVKPDYYRKHKSEILWYRDLYEEKNEKTTKQRTTDRITQAACSMSEAEDIVAILAPTTSGRTVRMIARIKPRVPVIGAAHDILNTRKLIISYGVWPIWIGPVSKREDGPEEMFRLCQQTINRDERLNTLLAKKLLIFTAGSPVAEPGTTNLIQIKMYEPPARPRMSTDPRVVPHAG